VTLAIETSGLRYRAGRSFELADVDLHVPAGSVYGFLGPNGAGKTTTIRLLLGLLKPAGGSITVLGQSIPGSIVAALARVGYAPERPHLYQSLTVAETLRYHRSFFPTWDDAWAADLLTQFDLDPSRKLSALSKGENGKLHMLLVTAQRPDLLVLDEPTDGLDPVVRRDVLSALLDYVTERKATVFISSHLVHELERICDWVGVMDRGRLVAELPMHEFKNGIKRLRVATAPADILSPPFTMLSRERGDGNGVLESWVVRGWGPGMHEYVEQIGGSVREVIDLDLEDGFVEMLRSSRLPDSSRHGRNG
jgi:ABC-2 type transport system ATP-binding protein